MSAREDKTLNQRGGVASGRRKDVSDDAQVAELRSAVEAAQRRAVALERELDMTRRSESFRIGHAIVAILNGRILRRLGAIEKLARRLSSAPSGLRGRFGSGGSLRSLVPASRQRSWTLKRTAGPSRQPSPDGVLLPAPPGNALEGHLPADAAPLMLIAWGLKDEELAQLLDDLAELQFIHRSFRPIIVTDSDALHVLHPHGWAYEHVPSPTTWMDGNPRREHEWPEFIGARMTSLLETYQPEQVLLYEHFERRSALRYGVVNGLLKFRSS